MASFWLYTTDRALRYTRVDQPLPGFAAQQMLGKRIDELLPASEVAELIALQQRVLDQAEGQQQELFLTLDGKLHLYAFSVEPLRDQHGQLNGLRGSAIEITEYKQTEQALRASEQRFAKVFHAGLQPMCITLLADGAYVDVNESFARMVGFARAEIIGRTALEIGIWSDPEERARATEVIMRQGQNQDFAHRFRDRNGAMHELVASGQLIDLEGQPCILSVVNDITEQKRSERNQQFLNELNAQTRLLIDPEAIEYAIVSRLGKYLEVDRCIIKTVDLAAGTATITHAWGEASESLTGKTYPLAAFGSPDYIAHAETGHTLVVENTATDPRTAVTQDPLLARNRHAIIRVPCFYQGRWVASLQLAHSVPRAWRADEVQLVETVTYQFWPLVEKARVEQRLRTSEERLRLAVEATGLGIWEMYPEYNEITWSTQGKAIHGLPAETKVTRELVKETIYPPDLEALQHALSAFYAPPRNRRLDTEHRIVRRDGAVRWIRVQGRFMDDGGEGQLPQRSLGTMLDITEHKRVEEENAASRRFLTRLAQAIPDSLMVYDLPSQRIIYHNRAQVRMLGLSDEQSLVQIHYELDARVHPEDRERVLEAAARLATASDEEVVEITFRYQWPSGEYRWLQERSVVFAREEAGAVSQRLSVSRDISEQKAAEQDLHFLAELAERIRLAEGAEHLIQQVAQALGEHLQVGRCLFIELDRAANRGLIRGQHCRGLPPVPGEYSLSDYSPTIGSELAAGHAIVNYDAQLDPRTAALYETTYAPAQERAYVGIPLLRSGEWRGILSVTSSEPRQWQPREITLLETVAERTWLAVEKLQLAADLHASEEELRVITDAVPGLIAYVDADERYRFVNATYERWFGLPREQIMGRRVAELVPDAYWQIKPYVERVLAGQAVTFESEFSYPDGRKTVLATYMPRIQEAGSVLGFYILVTDISERVAAEEALRASEERLRLATETGGIGIFDIDLVQRRGEFSPIYRLITQFPSEGQLTLKSWLERVHPADRTLVEQTLHQVFESSGAYRYEYRILLPGGAPRWVEVSGTGIQDEQGRTVRITGAMRDITVRKEAEEALRRSEARFRSIFESNMIGIGLWHGDGSIDEANDALLQLLGYTREDLEAHRIRWNRLTPPEYLPFEERASAESRTRGLSTPYEKEYFRKDGSRIPVIVGGAYFERDGSQGVFFALDISERKAAEEAIAADLKATQMLRDLGARLVAAGDPQVLYEEILSTGVALTAADAGTLQLLDDDAHELILLATQGFARHMTEHFHRVDASSGTFCGLALATGERSFVDFAVPAEDDPDGSLQMHLQAGYRSAQSTPLITRAGKPIGMVSTYWRSHRRPTDRELRFLDLLARQAADLIERKQVEDALRQLNETLEQRVAERTAELERSNRELDQYAYVASHDLKAPLRGIENLATFLEQDLGPTLPATSQRHLALLHGRIKRMEVLLDDLLAYSRAVRHRYVSEELDLTQIIGETIELLAPPASFVVEIVEPMPHLRAERVPIETIFRNLIGNAIKHHDQPAEGHVRITVVDQGECLKVTVADNGPGIDPLFHTRIFEIFQTLKPRDQVEGSGVGLAVVKKIVEVRGGAIWVESTPGAGAAFHFIWPKAPVS